MVFSTKNSLRGRFMDFVRFNKRYHQYEPVQVDRTAQVISPVEAKVVHMDNITSKGTIISKGDRTVDLHALIGHQAAQFFGGCYINFYLSPFNKHFWVTPSEGMFTYTQKNEGKSWMPIFTGLESLLGIEVFDRAVKKNASIGSVFKTAEFPIAMIAVGSLNVNRVCMDYKEQRNYERGIPCGYFSAGSSMLLCFPASQEFLVKEGDSVKIGEGIVK
jgi:phosphatidylserine decarboxylase